MKTHELKTVQPHFDAIVTGRKRVEIRWDDRGFEVGDVLVLREYHPASMEFTGKITRVCVTHVLRGFAGLAPGWVAMSICPESSQSPDLSDAMRSF